LRTRKSTLDKLERELRSLEKEIENKIELPSDPVEFAKKILNFTPLPYQEQLLRDPSKRIVVRMSRQTGKTTIIAVKAIWFAATHPKTLTLIVSPSMRQSMIMMDRIHSFLTAPPEKIRRTLIFKLQRTVVWFRNGSQIVALPCSIHLLRGYTAHMVLVDEGGFIRDDETLYYNVLYPMLATTDGTLIVSSTPWGKDSVFYKMNNDPAFSKHVVTWREAVASGLIKQEFIEEMQRVLPAERFQREFEAQFVEDADSYFPQDLITKCIDSELEYYSFEDHPTGDFYIGVDFGKKVDHSAIAVVERLSNGTIRLVHLFRFPLETPYASVIGYIKALSDRYKHVYNICVDQTGIGEYITEDMMRAGIPNVQGIVLTMQRKQEILGSLKQKMQNDQFRIPYDPDLIAEINIEKFELTKEGQIKFSHPEGAHDDRLWAVALAVYAASKSASVIEVGRGRLWK